MTTEPDYPDELDESEQEQLDPLDGEAGKHPSVVAARGTRQGDTEPGDEPEVADDYFDDGTATDETGDEFDPYDHSVSEVLAYIEANPDDADRVIELEGEGKARKSIVGD